MNTKRYKDTICLRCGYPIINVPEELYDSIKTCHMCRTSEENRRRDIMIKKIKEKGGW